MLVLDAAAPCDPEAPIDLVGARVMPEPYGWIVFILNALAPIFFGAAVGTTTTRRPIVLGVLAWFFSGVILWWVSLGVWGHNCPG